MPGGDYYTGISLAEALERFAEYHYAPDTRHISRDEYDMLKRAAAILSVRSMVT
jgi:hypothetical protein